MSENPVMQVVRAAGSKAALARALAVTDQAIYIWVRAGWMPVPRARQALELFPGATTLRELVREDIREAMDLSSAETLLN